MKTITMAQTLSFFAGHVYRLDPHPGNRPADT